MAASKTSLAGSDLLFIKTSCPVLYDLMTSRQLDGVPLGLRWITARVALLCDLERLEVPLDELHDQAGVHWSKATKQSGAAYTLTLLTTHHTPTHITSNGAVTHTHTHTHTLDVKNGACLPGCPDERPNNKYVNKSVRSSDSVCDRA